MRKENKAGKSILGRPGKRAQSLEGAVWRSLIIAVGVILCGWNCVASGTWTPLVHPAPGGIGTMLLLSDGTVMAQNSGTAIWYRLSPDIHGSYASGTWSNMAAMHDTRLYFSSDVLTDGRVFIAGAEYGTGTNTGEVYDPRNNTWTSTPAPGQTLFDSVSKILPNGNVLVAPVFPTTSGGTLIYVSASNQWTAGPHLFRGSYQDEASWVKLADNSILTIDPFGTHSERLIPSLNQWVDDGVVPVSLYNNIGELGAAFLLPNGRAIFLGGTSHTAIYTPSGSTSPGSWAAGPDFPSAHGASDAPAAMMVNGKILCATGSATNYAGPVVFYEYDYLANSFTLVPGPTPSNSDAPYYTRMLDLPDGSVLYADSGSQLYVYQPDGAPLAAGKPVINNISQNPDGSYHLTGTLLNGITEGAAYGDDAQMDSNYPLVRLSDGAGNLYYGRTYNWSSTSVMTSNLVVTTEFTVPATVPQGTLSLVVVANGNSSDPVILSADPLSVSPVAPFVAAGPVGGPFNPASQDYSLTNLGGTSISWSVINTSAWLTVSSAAGTLTPGGSAATVTVGLAAAANSLASGIYAANVLFSNATGVAQMRQVTLQVATSILQNGGFETGDFSFWTLSGDAGLNFVQSAAGGYGAYVHSGLYGGVFGEPSILAYLSQVVQTTPGQLYQLSFWYTSPDGATPSEINASWNGAVVFDQVNPGIGWNNVQMLVVASSTSTTVQFGLRNDPSYLGLDDVSLLQVFPPRLQAPVMSGPDFTVTLSTVPGVNYQLQYTTSLNPATWVNVGAASPAPGNTLTLTDPAPPDAQRFYRVAIVP